MTPGARPMFLLSSGMVTAVGNSAAATCAAVRAGVFGIERINLFDPESGEIIQSGRPRVPQWWEGPEMLAELAAPAIEQCLEGSSPSAADVTPVLCILPPPDRGVADADLTSVFVTALEHRLERRLPKGSATSRSGRVGLWPALARARSMLERGQADHCIVVGADSYLRQDVIAEFLRRRRIHTPTNSNGFIPGEGAAAVMVSLQPPQGRDGNLCVAAMGMGTEPDTIDGDTPLRGIGLTAAVRQAFEQIGAEFSSADLWINDQNGEHYKFKESTFVRIRFDRLREVPRGRPMEVWHPIQYFGDIGCAVGPCLMGVALAAHRKGYAPGPRTLLHVSEDSGGRGAMILDWTQASA